MTSKCNELEEQNNAFSTYDNLFNDINVLQEDKNALEIKIQVLKGEVSKQNEILQKNKLYFESIEFFKNKTIENTINKIKNSLNNVKKRCEPIIKLIFKILITMIILYIIWLLFRNNIFKYIITFYTKNISVFFTISLVISIISLLLIIDETVSYYLDFSTKIIMFIIPISYIIINIIIQNNIS